VGPVTGDVVAVDTRQRRVVRQVGDLSSLDGPSVIKAAAGLVWVSGEKGTVGIDPANGHVKVRVGLGARGFGGLDATDTDLWLHPGDPFASGSTQPLDGPSMASSRPVFRTPGTP
jgi:hypothetical protein